MLVPLENGRDWGEIGNLVSLPVLDLILGYLIMALGVLGVFGVLGVGDELFYLLEVDLQVISVYDI